MADIIEVTIRDESILLGQFLKLAGLVESGSDAKFVIADEQVLVNGAMETRRGRQLRSGDLVALRGAKARVVQDEGGAVVEEIVEEVEPTPAPSPSGKKRRWRR
ncbi:RNA-binding S4 domain-containing protein [Tsukamurella soli]|uniref:Ribosome-associated protein n=1 Tax=Tsukamurella soli TaxID=644556 RepID=A0ABP8JKP2_9ACTN